MNRRESIHLLIKVKRLCCHIFAMESNDRSNLVYYKQPLVIPVVDDPTVIFRLFRLRRPAECPLG